MKMKTIAISAGILVISLIIGLLHDIADDVHTIATTTATTARPVPFVLAGDGDYFPPKP